jgi:integrase
MSVPRAPVLGEPDAGWSLTPSELAEVAIAGLEASSNLASASADRLFGLMRRFATFTQNAYAILLASGIRAEHVQAFVEARTASGGTPSVATMHLRRSAVRLLFREATGRGAISADVTSEIVLPPRSYLPFRALTDDEIALGRSFSRGSLSTTRDPAAWALSEAGARSSELPYIRVCDVDLDAERVFIVGGAKTSARWGDLTTWGLIQVRRRLEILQGSGHEAALVCADATNRTRARANAYEAVRASLVRAGLGDEPGVRPNSIVAWRGALAHRAGASIAEIAHMLGFRSLDATAAFIGWEWRTEDHG